MRNRSDEGRRIWVFLSLFAAVLVLISCSRIQPAPTSERLVPRIESSEYLKLDFWDKLGSALGGIAGLLALVLAVSQFPAFLEQQRRIADDLNRKPELWVAINACTIEDGKVVGRPIRTSGIAVPFETGAVLSRPVNVGAYIRNVGTRTARDLLITFLFPRHIVVLEPTHPRMTRDTAHDGHPLVTVMSPYLHQLDYTLLRVTVQVPRTSPTIDYVVSVSLAEVPSQELPFQLHVRQVPGDIPPV